MRPYLKRVSLIMRLLENVDGVAVPALACQVKTPE